MLTAQPALPTPRTARPASWQTDTCRPVHRDSILRSSAGIPAGYGANSSDNTRVYPCSEAYCIACSANASNCSACDSATNGYYLNPFCDSTNLCQASGHSSRSRYQINRLNQALPLAATPTARLAQPTTELLCLQHREWLPLAPFHRPTKLCHASDSSIQVRSERHRLLQSVPVPRNQVSRLQGQRIELLCLRSRRIGHPQLVRCTSDLRSSISSSSRLRESTRLTSAGSTLVPTRTASAVQPTSRTALRATSRTESCSTLTPACLPVSLQVQSHPATVSTRLTQPESTLAWMLTAQPALPTPRTARPASWQTDTCSTRTPRFHPAFSQPESQQATEPTRATTPECTHAQKPTALHAAPTPRTVLLATSLSMATLGSLPSAANLCQDTNFPSGYGLNSADYTKVYPLQRLALCLMLCQLLELLCLQHREWLPLAPFTDPPSCVTPATVPSKYGLNDTDSSRVYPCLETKCLACKANASNCSACDLAASVILNSFVAPPTSAFLHLQLLQATESTRLTSAGSTLVPTRTASAVQPTSRTALRATSRTESCSTLTPACLPVSLQVQSHPATASTRLTQPESTLAWMLTAQPALPTPRTARPASWQTDTCSTRTPRFHPAFSQPESQQATEPTRATTPECTHAQKPTALHMQRQRLELFCFATSLSMATS